MRAPIFTPSWKFEIQRTRMPSVPVIWNIRKRRKNLRKFFEVDKEHLVAYSLSALAKEQLIPSKYAKDAIKKYNIDTEKPMPTKL